MVEYYNSAKRRRALAPVAGNDAADHGDQELSACREAVLATHDDHARHKPVHETPNGMFDYAILRCVRSAMRAVKQVVSTPQTRR